MNIRKQLYVFLLCLLTYAMNMAEGAEESKVYFRLTVLHNDDAESQLIDAGPGLEDLGGVARFATLAGQRQHYSCRYYLGARYIQYRTLSEFVSHRAEHRTGTIQRNR